MRALRLWPLAVIVGSFHPDGPSYPSVLFAFEETNPVCGLARSSKGSYRFSAEPLHNFRIVRLGAGFRPQSVFESLNSLGLFLYPRF